VIERRSEIGPYGGSTLRHYLQTLRRRKWIGLAPVVLLPIVVFVSSHRQQALYEATADVLVNQQELAATSVIGQTPAIADPDRTMVTLSQLARVPTVAERALVAAGVRGKSPRALLNRSVVYSNADLLRFTVDDPNPTLATKLATAYAKQFVRYKRELDTAGLAQTLSELEGQMKDLAAAGKSSSPLYVRLADRQQQLESLKALRESNINAVKTPAPDDFDQVAPRPLRNTALALVAGVVLGLVLAFLSEALSTRPRSEDEIEALLGMPCLGRVNLGAKSGGVAMLEQPGGPVADAFHSLRANLELANRDVGAKTMMLTSLHAGDGATAVAANLAVAFARTGRHVVLADLDLRGSALTRLFDLEGRAGMTSLGHGDGAEMRFTVPLGDERELKAGAGSRPMGPDARLEVVGSGPLPAHPAEFLSSDRLAAAITLLEQRADIVLAELPPLLDAPDATAASTRLDGLVVVLDARRVRRGALADARRLIDAWPIARLGFLLVEGQARLLHPLSRVDHQVTQNTVRDVERVA
jgi:Mrp family chromosome partitioning ATPase